MKNNDFVIRQAKENDLPLILKFIHELAVYEKMEEDVVATEELLSEWMFDKKICETLIGYEKDVPIGFALYFYNFSTFVGRGGLYLEDIYIQPEYRNKGYGKAFFIKLAQIAEEQKCGRMEWSCLDWNRPSIDFYLKMGAIPMDGWTVYRLAGESLENAASMMQE